MRYITDPIDRYDFCTHAYNGTGRTAPGRLQSPPPQIGRRLQSHHRTSRQLTDGRIGSLSPFFYHPLPARSRFIRGLFVRSAKGISVPTICAASGVSPQPRRQAHIRPARHACAAPPVNDTHASLDRGRWKRRNIRFHINISVRVSAYRVGIVAPSSSSLAFLSC